MKFSGIYKIQSKAKPKRIYVGSAVNIKERWWEHKSQLRRNSHHSKKLQFHFNKYGESDLQYSVLLGCEPANLLIHEQFFIDALDPHFNICKKAGSCYGKLLSEESKRKISESHKGMKHSPETRKKLSLNHIGVPHPHVPGQDENISKSQRGRKLTEEHKKKLSLAKIGYTPWNKGMHTGHTPWNKGMKNVYGTAKKGKKLINGEYVKINAN